MEYPELLLENQICFRIYTLQRMVMAAYKPLLDSINLTYLQYITMLVLWENDHLSVTQICKATQLDVGTISPMLKRMENQNLISRNRGESDERKVLISLTSKGRELQHKAASIPHSLSKCFVNPDAALTEKNMEEVSTLIDTLITSLESNIERKK